MEKLLLIVALLLDWPTAGLSQAGQSAPTVPNYTVFGGYTTVRNRFDYGPPGSVVPGPAFYVSGWEASIERKILPWVGIVADVSQQYGARSGGPFVGLQQENQTFALFGPQFSLRAAHSLIPFAHVLLGEGYGTVFLEYIYGPVPSTIKAFEFTTAVGGGADIKITGPVWLRAVQVEYLHANTDFNGDHATQMRISAGIAFRF